MKHPLEPVMADRPCPLTGTREAAVVATRSRDGGELRNVISLASGLIYVDPLPREDLAKFYREEYRVSYKQTFTPKPEHILRAARVCRDRLGHSGGIVKKGMRCLDIGAGGGEWVYYLKTLGCESRGIEPNEGYGSFAKDHYGVEVFLGMYQDADLPAASFDVLSLFQVLEHLADPVTDLRRMSAYLKPGGRFLIEVPDILFAGMRFDHKWHAGHLFGFDALTLEAVAAKAGLRKVSLEVLPGNLFGVFEKTGEESLALPELGGHCEEAGAALRAGRARYWALPRTYGKVPRRLLHRIAENCSSRRAGGPREILDSVFQNDAA
ncbi:MAG: class I SAM-dependent methyltransferase [Verrucomicrobiaceae bacterium]|nr:class I SAM-dependent methyltransferase [Verrucomicrobiaceae bacterium]